ncbi:MAG: hypothetical protein HZA50_09190 [Planctomycetes bacterium]|nr:hypothetical protein [Planctomycetota bacterium]
MRLFWITILAVLSACGAGRGDVTAKLTVAQKQDEGLAPYRTAVLEVKNDAKEPIVQLAIRNSRGGATYIHDCSVPPGSNRVITVGLPATDLRQTYEVRPYTAAGPAEKAITCEIIWPSAQDLVNPQEFIDPQLYRQWEKLSADQPGYNKKALVLLGLLLLLVEAGVLSFVRGPRLKLILAVAGAAGVLAATWVYLGRQEVVNAAEYYTNLPGPPGQADGKCRTTILLAHRTVLWSTADWQALPVYFSRGQMDRDDAAIHVGKEIRMTLRPGQMRIIRRYFTAPPPASLPSVPPESSPSASGPG